MICSACGTENPPAAKFCMSCGTPTALTCSSCRTELPEGARFCFSCGAQVGAAPAAATVPTDESEAPEPDEAAGLRRFVPDELMAKLEYATTSGGMQGERRTVTMLFCDVQGSTAAAEKLDPEEWADIMNGAFEHLIAPVYRYEGTLARLMGDAILAFFGAPIGHEDDPERAVLAALEILEEIKPYCSSVKQNWGIDIAVRVGINTGLVVVGAVGSDLRVEYTAMGDAVNLASRLESTAAPGTVQISADTHRLVQKLFAFEELGAIEVKGREEPVTTYRVLAALERPEVLRGIEGLQAPLTGRDDELTKLTGAMEEVARTGRGRVMSVMGEAGLGKSRLVAELKESLSDDAQAAWHVGRSLSYETAAPYTPVRRILRSLFGLRGGEADAETWRHIETAVAAALPGRVGDVAPFLAWMLDCEVPAAFAHRLGYLQPPQLRAEGFRATLELLEATCTSRPITLVFEDLHWADPASIDLVIELLGIVERSALALILIFRPRRNEGSWRVHQAAEQTYPHVYAPIALSPLPEEHTRELVSNLLAVDGLTEDTRRLILDKSDGNPFFVEEIIRSMIDLGIVVHDGERWVATEAAATFAVPENLSAVLTTRLDGLEEGSRRVAQAASVVGRRFQYDELAAALTDVTGLDEGLTELQRRDLIREVTRIPKRLFQFKHALVQEAAYATVLLKQRTQLHGAIADFLMSIHPDRTGDIADHLVKSRQLGRAVPYLVDAGEHAARAYALPVALERFTQALDGMDAAADPALLRRALEGLGQAHEYLFDFPAAGEAYQRLRAEGERLGDEAMRISGMNKYSFIRGFFFDQRQEALDELAEAEQRARDSDDDLGLIEACTAQCYLRTGYAEFDQVEYYMREVASLGQTLGKDDATLFGLVHYANTLVYLTRYDDALAEAERALEIAEHVGNLKYQAELLTFALPTCYLRNGDAAAATASVERGMELAQRIGDRGSEAYAAVFHGKAAMHRGYLDDALALFRRARAATDATGIPYLQALGLCVTGTCYQQIGGPALETALEYHDRTLETMELPTGMTLGAWLWSEIGHCALAAGKVDDARELFAKAINEKTAPMFLMRPSALQGQVELALSEQDLGRAARLAAELSEYVTTREMRDVYHIAWLTAGKVAAASGDHEAALKQLAECEAVATEQEMRRFMLDVLALKATSLDVLGRGEEAADARATADGLAAQIASGMNDAGLRAAFLQSTAARLAPSV